MRTDMIFGCLLLVCASLFCPSCKEADILYAEKVIIVDSKKELAMDDASAIEVLWLRVKYKGIDPGYWYLYNAILNFDYEEGYLYELRVIERTNRNPRQDEWPITFELIEQISKTKVPE